MEYAAPITNLSGNLKTVMYKMPRNSNCIVKDKQHILKEVPLINIVERGLEQLVDLYFFKDTLSGR